MEKPLVNKRYKLEKIPGKGGWTYAAIPEIKQDRKAPFGWVKVRGWIDTVEIRNYRLMPMGNGQLFLPLKAALRKTIGKQEGDWIKVVLYADDTLPEIPEDLRLCLADEPKAFNRFMTFTEGEQKAYIDWIYRAKKEDTRVGRMAKTVNRVLKGLKFHDPG